MRPIYAERREALLDVLHRALGEWLQPIPSEAGLHLAARIRDPALAPKIMPIVLHFAAGAESTADYAMACDIEPMVTFGYGVIDAEEITAALIDLRRVLEKRPWAVKRASLG
jgi:GntR family transcriptional regulator/MocR family aminotransferase